MRYGPSKPNVDRDELGRYRRKGTQIPKKGPAGLKTALLGSKDGEKRKRAKRKARGLEDTGLKEETPRDFYRCGRSTKRLCDFVTRLYRKYTGKNIKAGNSPVDFQISVQKYAVGNEQRSSKC